jgi:polar amino acid transport system substrate-binding protein
VDGLQAGKVRAVVASAPLLQYFDATHPKLPITEVGPVFAPYNYGFALAPGSALRQPLNAALLRLQESGVMFDLGQKYFGAAYQP